MKQPIINIDAKPDWQTYYDPKLVGKYMIEHDRWVAQNYNFGELLEFKPGMMIIPPPTPSLEGFLKWCAGESLEARDE